MSGFLRKLLTRPIHWYETNRPYPIRRKVLSLSPIPIPDKGDRALVVLCTPRTVLNAAWTIMSFLQSMKIELRVVLVVDAPDTSSAQALRTIFPGLDIRSTCDLYQRYRNSAPHLYKLAHRHPMGRKLASIHSLNEEFHILFLDDDILAFREVPELDAAMSATIPPALYIRDIASVQLDPVIRDLARLHGHAWCDDLNAGLLLIPRSSLILSLSDALLVGQHDIHGWFPDTAVLAVQLRSLAARGLPSERYCVSVKRQFYFEPDEDYSRIAVRHFISPVRHLMYLKGMPYVFHFALARRTDSER